MDTTAPRSRRALLSAAAGAIGALAVQAGFPRASVRAANGDPLVLGSLTNTATESTKLASSATGVSVLVVETTNGTAIGVHAGTGDGVAVSAASGSGVIGSATTGQGVVGDATAGIGVSGYADHGTAVFGHSPNGIGVHATSEDGLALSVDGKVRLSRSGRAWIRTGKGSVTLAAPGTTPASRVFAVLASNRPGSYVRAVVPTTDAFTVYLNKVATSDSVVSWFILD